MNDKNDKLDHIIELLAQQKTMLEALLEGKKSARRKVNADIIPPAELQKHRENEILRIFNKLATAKHFQKTAQYFPKCIIQPRGQDDNPVESVPLSILLNRLEMLKAFWPTVNETNIRKPRDVVSNVLGALFHRGVLERGNCLKLYPQAHESDVEIVLSAKEAQKRRDWLRDGDDEGVDLPLKRKKDWESDDDDETFPEVEAPPRILPKKNSKPLWPGQDEEEES